MVISAIVVLTTLGVEFAYNTSVGYHLAQNERARLQAYYMAKSAYNFMLLELKFDRVFRQVVQSQNLGEYLGENAQLPLCQQFPMSTGLIRAVFMGGEILTTQGDNKGAGEEGAEGESITEDKEARDESLEEMRKGTSISQEKTAAEFLEFEGDFDAECIDEGTKINLNGFAGLATTALVEGQMSPLDQYKQYLYRFLSQPKYELLFKTADVRVTDVVNNIGDWIDEDTTSSEIGGKSGNAERLKYDKLELKYPVRNGRLLTLLEAYLIDGVDDDWFYPMMNDFTVYGDGKVNVCTASKEILETVIKRYVESTPGLPPLRLEDPEEMKRLTTAVTDICKTGASGEALKQQIATALNTAIGAVSQSPLQPAPQSSTQLPASQAQQGFGSYITTESRYFSLKLTGQIQQTTVRIMTILDVKDQDPKKWKILYWKVY